MLTIFLNTILIGKGATLSYIQQISVKFPLKRPILEVTSYQLWMKSTSRQNKKLLTIEKLHWKDFEANPGNISLLNFLDRCYIFWLVWALMKIGKLLEILAFQLHNFTPRYILMDLFQLKRDEKGNVG